MLKRVTANNKMETGDLNYDLTLIDFNIAVDFSE